MTAVTVHSDLGIQKNKICHCFQCFPFYLPWNNVPRCHNLSFLNAEFQANLKLSSFTIIKRLLSSSSLSAIKEVSSAYLKLLIFFLAILIPAYDSSSPAFHMMHSANKLNKQGDNIQSWHTLHYCFLICIRVSLEAGKVVWYSHLFENCPQFLVILTAKGISVVNEAEEDVSLELFCFLHDPAVAGYLISGSSAFLNPTCASESSLLMYCWSLAWRIWVLPC